MPLRLRAAGVSVSRGALPLPRRSRRPRDCGEQGEEAMPAEAGEGGRVSPAVGFPSQGERGRRGARFPPKCGDASGLGVLDGLVVRSADL